MNKKFELHTYPNGSILVFNKFDQSWLYENDLWECFFSFYKNEPIKFTTEENAIEAIKEYLSYKGPKIKVLIFKDWKWN